MNNARWANSLYRLRSVGRRRAEKGQPSSSVLALLNHVPDEAVVIDIGCGDSGDRRIAEQLGCKAFSLDLFRPTLDWLRKDFMQGDALSLPLRSQSVDGIVFHAVGSLIDPAHRSLLYAEMARVLKPNGLVAAMFYLLADGFPVTEPEERSKMEAAGILYSRSTGLYRKVCYY